MCSITDEFLKDIGNECSSFRLVQADAPGKTTLGNETDLRDEKFVDLEIVLYWISKLPMSIFINWSSDVRTHGMPFAGVNHRPGLTSRGTRCIFAQSENRNSAADCGKA